VDPAVAPALGQLLDRGILGVIAALEAYTIIALYRALMTERDRNRQEVADMLERHIVKAENFGQKQTELAGRVLALAERLGDRMRPRDGGEGG
jgi:hypothetical protein